MTIVSMTGFSRVAGSHAQWRWAWELKSVNARGLDVRVRVPSGFDALEAQARAKLAKALGRGTCYANLSAQREASSPELRVNEQALGTLREAIARMPADPNIAPASLDGLLAIRGIVEFADTEDDEETRAAVAEVILASLDEAINGLAGMRATEGAALHAVLAGKTDMIAELTQKAEECPDRQPEHIRARLQRSIDELSANAASLDSARLHQEALLIAAKADVREELDRLVAHVDAVRELLKQQEPVGRRLDFLAQELGREANTLCSKSSGADLSAIGMELRVQIEQFREQVQNIE